MSARNYDELASQAAQGKLAVKKGTVRRADETVREDARANLLDATGTSTTEDAISVAVGRPSLGAGSGRSPVIRARVPQKTKDAISSLAASQNRKESDVLRDALAAYLEVQQA